MGQFIRQQLAEAGVEWSQKTEREHQVGVLESHPSCSPCSSTSIEPHVELGEVS